MGLLTGPATLRALDLEFHAAAHLGDLSRALTLGAGSPTAGRSSFASRADLLARHLQAHHSTTDSGPEVYCYRVLKVGSRLWPLLSLLLLGKHAGKNIPEATPARASCGRTRGLVAGRIVGEVKAAKINRSASTARLPRGSPRRARAWKTTIAATRRSFSRRRVNLVGVVP
jgi:hypothetical protein